MILKINIGYESNIPKAQQIMLDIATKQQDILTKPVPTAVVSNFTDTSVELSLSAFTADVFNRGDNPQYTA